jgi:hypothetical protein
MEGLAGVFVLVAALFVAVFMLFGTAAMGRKRRKEARRQIVTKAAGSLGLQNVDDHRVSSAEFALRSKGAGSAASNFITGSYKSVPVTLFDLSTFAIVSNGRRAAKTYSWYSCAVTEVPAELPHLVIEPDKSFSRLDTEPAGIEDVRIGSTAFDRMFAVRLANLHSDGVASTLKVLAAEDARVRALLEEKSEIQRRFAETLLDTNMIEFLLSTAGVYSFEILGRYVLCYRSEVDPSLFPSLLDTLVKFRERIPRAAFAMFAPQQPEEAEERVVDLTTSSSRAEPMPDAAASPLGISPEELPLAPDDPRLEELLERLGPDVLRAAGLLPPEPSA